MDAYEKQRSFRDTLFGKVRYGMHKATQTPVVIKEYEIKLVEARVTRDGVPVNEDALRELHLHAHLCKHVQNPYIVRLLDCQQDSDKYYAVLEYCSRGEFFSFVQNTAFNETYAIHYFSQLCTGVAFMHEMNVCHRDLSLENLLLSEDGVLKICDFGVAIDAAENAVVRDPSGNPAGKTKYMAPEVFAGLAYDPRKADVWSCGVILFIMLVKVFPFNLPCRSDERFNRVCQGRANELIKQWGMTTIHPLAIDLLKHIFCPAEHRYSVKDIIDHPYLHPDRHEAASLALMEADKVAQKGKSV